MTTLNTQLARLAKSFGMLEDKSHPSVIPPQILLETKGLMFFKKLGKGKQSSQVSQGIYFQRKGISSWSQPLAIQIKSSDLYWGNSPRVDRTDVVVLVLDESIAYRFRTFGQVGFDDNSTNKIKKGVCVENNEASFIRFTTVLSERPDLMTGAAFSYGLFDGHFFPVHLESPIFQFRESSNNKFYDSVRVLDSQSVLQNGVPVFDVSKSGAINQAQTLISRHFDIQKRYPEYFSEGGAPALSPMGSPVSPNPALSASANNSPTMTSRQWSDSTTSSHGSDADPEFRGYHPRPSDFGAREFGNMGSPMKTESAKFAPPPSMWESKDTTTIEVPRVRATSFDFS